LKEESEIEMAMWSYMTFDYDAPAELYMPKHKSIGRRPATGYRRFSTAAEAIRFAIENARYQSSRCLDASGRSTLQQRGNASVLRK
jgi:hypothetical protein